MVDETPERGRDDVFEGVLADLSGPVLLTTSTVEDFAGLVAALRSGAFDGDPNGDADVHVRALVDAETAKAVRDAFPLASRVADLIDAGALDVRVAEPRTPFSTLLLGDGEFRGVVSMFGVALTELRADADEALVDDARERYRDEWTDADPFSSRAPPYSRMLETLGERLGEATRADLERVLEGTTGVRSVRVDVRPVRLSLLVGAKNEVQFYELGLWGESEGVASRAKFSREKQTLEERGLLETEKVPTDVGRPRQRLVLPERLRGNDPLDLADAARDAERDRR